MANTGNWTALLVIAPSKEDEYVRVYGMYPMGVDVRDGRVVLAVVLYA